MTGTGPALFVIFGATGDLAARQLLPALYRLAAGTPEGIVVLGVATRELDDAGFRSRAAAALAAAGHQGDHAAAWCREWLHFHRIGPEGPGGMVDRIRDLEEHHRLSGNRVFYLAMPPGAFPGTIAGLGASGLNRSPGWTRLVIEKPFGRDLESARHLNDLVHRHFDEDQVYRIDHYLGKETVQNLLVFRFTNPIFEASWNRDRVARVEITVAEADGVGERGRYYDQAGVVRDMLQSHLTQVLTLVAMEAPVSMSAEAIRAEKLKVLRSISPVAADQVVLGQYTSGVVPGREMPGYRSLDGVDPASATPTFAAVRLHVENWRWQGVPFVLRTGKAMAERTTQVVVTFRPPPICLFHGPGDGCSSQSDRLYLTLQPDEGFRLEIEVKVPGEAGGLRTIPLRFGYADEFGALPDAYETLLADILRGDQTLFVHADEVEAAWRLFDPIADAGSPPHPYPAGSWGPADAADILDGGRWAVGS